MSLLKNFQTHIFHHNLIQAQDRLVVGVSGGPDSVGLIWLLNKIKKSKRLEIIVAHVNYGLRAEDSEADEQLVRRLARQLNCPIVVERFSVEGKKRGNKEELMRDFRYAFFEKVLRENDFDKIAVAHTLDDQVETFLMNLIRGSGLAGLIALKQQRQKLIRPLLSFSKQEVLDWLEQEGVEFRLDKTNRDNRLYRNSIRNELIPFLEEKYNPAVKKRIAGLAEQLEQINDLVENDFKNSYTEAVVEESSGQIILDASKVDQENDFLIGRCFREAVQKLTGDCRNLTGAQVVEFKKILKSTKGKNQRLKIKNLVIEKIGQRIIFRKNS